MSGGWKEVLQQQQNELERLEALDSELNTQNTDIDKFLKRPKSASKLPARQKLAESNSRRMSESELKTIMITALDVDPPDNELQTNSMSELEAHLDFKSIAPTEDDATRAAKAPETTIRYQKARINILMKQVDDAQQLKKQMSEQISELQKSVKVEREDNKSLKKRIGTLELELKRSASRRPSETGPSAGTSVDALQQVRSLIMHYREPVSY